MRFVLAKQPGPFIGLAQQAVHGEIDGTQQRNKAGEGWKTRLEKKHNQPAKSPTKMLQHVKERYGNKKKKKKHTHKVTF